MVRDGFGDESGAKLIEQRGIDFAPSEDFIQSLKTAGASDAFVAALRAAKPPEPANAQKPINQIQVFALLASQVPSHRVSTLVQERGIDFEPTDDYLQEVRLAGGEDELISALKGAKVTKPADIDPAIQTRQTDVRRHFGRGIQFDLAKQYADAEAEYRAAMRLDPQNSDTHLGLAMVLSDEGNEEGAISEFREALSLDPKNEFLRETLILFLRRAAMRLARKGELDATVPLYREALEANPNNSETHSDLGDVLGQTGDWEGDIREQHESLRLNPDNELAHMSLGFALGSKGDSNGAVGEYREALRLNPNNEVAHSEIGLTLGLNGDWDGAVAEFRTAVRIKPDDAAAHEGLGTALEAKGNQLQALDEFRTAYELKPSDHKYREAYERLAQQTNH